MTFRLSTATLLCLSVALPALAEPATPEGAAQIEAAFRTYLGQAPGVVAVTPDGDSYDATVDPAALAAGIKGVAVPQGGAPIHLTLTDKGDGLWNVAQDEPIEIAFDIPGVLSIDLRATSSTWNGTFDTNLFAFRESGGAITNLLLTERVSESGGPVSTVTYTLDRIEMETATTSGVSGGVDGTMRYTATGLKETVAVEGGPGAAMPMSFDLSADRYEVETNTKAVQTQGIYGLVAWLVAHPDKDAAQADFEGMKSTFRAALPLWQTISGTGTMTNIKVATPYGAGGAESAAFEIDLNGAVKDGLAREKIAVKGLTLPTEIMPEWVVPLLPSEATIDFAGSGYDLATPAQILLDKAEQGVPPSDALKAELLAALLPNGAVTVTIAPGSVVTPTYGLTYEGRFDAGPGRMPEGGITIGATGVDAALAALDKAPDDVKSSAVPGIMMLRGIAKPAGVGGYSWQIDMTADGKILVNGLDMSALGGAMP